MRKILLLLLLGIFLCGCAATPETPYVPTGDALDWDNATQPTETEPMEQELVLMYYPQRSMNPLQSTDYTNRTLFSLLYQGLFSVDSNYVAHPVLCDSYYVSPDMRVYTFYVANATFSDSTPVTPEDVYATLDYARDCPIYAGRFQHVYQMELTEDGGIRFRLDTPMETFPLLLDVPILKGSQLEEAFPLGSGPYQYEQTHAGARLRQCRDWWCKAKLPITATSIPLLEAESPTQIRDSFELANVGLVCADPSSNDYAGFRCDYELWDCENGNFLFLGCNLDSPVFGKADLRSALTYAIERNMLADEVYYGFARSTTLPVSPQSPFYLPGLAARYAYQPDLFAQAVTNAELEPETVVQFLVNRDDSMRLYVAKLIRDMLTECGLAVELLEYDQEDFLKALEKGSYDLYLGQTRLSANMDLSAFFAPTGSISYGGMSDASLYALCLESLANHGNFYNLHSKIAADGRLCPILFQSYAIYATRGIASNLNPSRDNVFFYDRGLTLEAVRREPAEQSD